MSVTINEVRKVYDEFNEAYTKSTTAEMEEKTLKAELVVYKDIIENFFYINRATIKGIYEAIKFGALPYNKVFCKDVNKIAFDYNDYLNGLIIFVNKFMDIRKSDDINKDKIDISLSKIIEKDKRFIEDLFIGVFKSADTNIEDECYLSDAMKNVEYLIKLCDFLKEVSETAEDFASSISKVDDEYKDYALRAFKLYVTSVRFYIVNIIETIANCYNSIVGSTSHRTPVSGDKKEPTYQIF